MPAHHRQTEMPVPARNPRSCGDAAVSELTGTIVLADLVAASEILGSRGLAEPLWEPGRSDS